MQTVTWVAAARWDLGPLSCVSCMAVCSSPGGRLSAKKHIPLDKAREVSSYAETCFSSSLSPWVAVLTFGIDHTSLKTKTQQRGQRDPPSGATGVRCICYFASGVLMFVLPIGLWAAWLLPRRRTPGPPQNSDGSDGMDSLRGDDGQDGPEVLTDRTGDRWTPLPGLARAKGCLSHCPGVGRSPVWTARRTRHLRLARSQWRIDGPDSKLQDLPQEASLGT